MMEHKNGPAGKVWPLEIVHLSRNFEQVMGDIVHEWD